MSPSNIGTSRSQGIVVEYERVRSELESLWQRLAELG